MSTEEGIWPDNLNIKNNEEDFLNMHYMFSHVFLLLNLRVTFVFPYQAKISEKLNFPCESPIFKENSYFLVENRTDPTKWIN